MRYALVMLSALILSACGRTTGTAVTAERVCAVWPVTTWSARDTTETIRGNKFNNARRAGFCGED